MVLIVETGHIPKTYTHLHSLIPSNKFIMDFNTSVYTVCKYSLTIILDNIMIKDLKFKGGYISVSDNLNVV